MKILFAGVRGTTPRADTRFYEYGGHTTCLLVRGAGGEHLLLDAGSGVQVVNEILLRDKPAGITVLMTHLHLDHVVGLPLIASLFDPDCAVQIVAASHDGASPTKALDGLIVPPLWPLTLGQMPAATTVREVAPAELDGDGPLLAVGGLEVRGTPLPHPNGCTAWRVDEPSTGASLVFATDMEWDAAQPGMQEAFLKLNRTPRSADLLVMDGHFTAAELPRHVGWGHSSTAQCVEAARAADVGRLLVTHHAPESDDERLRDVEAELKAMWDRAALARQYEEIELGA